MSGFLIRRPRAGGDPEQGHRRACLTGDFSRPTPIGISELFLFPKRAVVCEVRNRCSIA